MKHTACIYPRHIEMISASIHTVCLSLNNSNAVSDAKIPEWYWICNENSRFLMGAHEYVHIFLLCINYVILSEYILLNKCSKLSVSYQTHRHIAAYVLFQVFGTNVHTIQNTCLV